MNSASSGTGSGCQRYSAAIRNVWAAAGVSSLWFAGCTADGTADPVPTNGDPGCKWGGSYLTEATTLIAAIKAKETIEGGENFLKPASGGLDSCQNVSYASLGYYRAFAKKKPDRAAFWKLHAAHSLG